MGFIGLDIVDRNKPKVLKWFTTSPRAKLHCETVEWLRDFLQKLVNTDKVREIILFAHHPIVGDRPLRHRKCDVSDYNCCSEESEWNGFSWKELQSLADIFNQYGISEVNVFAGHVHFSEKPGLLFSVEDVFRESANKVHTFKVKDVKFTSVTTEAVMHEIDRSEGVIRIVTLRETSDDPLISFDKVYYPENFFKK